MRLTTPRPGGRDSRHRGWGSCSVGDCARQDPECLTSPPQASPSAVATAGCLPALAVLSPSMRRDAPQPEPVMALARDRSRTSPALISCRKSVREAGSMPCQDHTKSSGPSCLARCRRPSRHRNALRGYSARWRPVRGFNRGNRARLAKKFARTRTCGQGSPPARLPGPVRLSGRPRHLNIVHIFEPQRCAARSLKHRSQPQDRLPLSRSAGVRFLPGGRTGVSTEGSDELRESPSVAD
jgi:hypothetical protein